jgi:hypothetical protein
MRASVAMQIGIEGWSSAFRLLVGTLKRELQLVPGGTMLALTNQRAQFVLKNCSQAA